MEFNKEMYDALNYKDCLNLLNTMVSSPMTQSPSKYKWAWQVSNYLINRYCTENNLNWDNYFIKNNIGSDLKDDAVELEAFSEAKSNKRKQEILDKFQKNTITSIKAILDSLS